MKISKRIITALMALFIITVVQAQDIGYQMRKHARADHVHYTNIGKVMINGLRYAVNNGQLAHLYNKIEDIHILATEDQDKIGPLLSDINQILKEDEYEMLQAYEKDDSEIKVYYKEKEKKADEMLVSVREKYLLQLYLIEGSATWEELMEIHKKSERKRAR